MPIRITGLTSGLDTEAIIQLWYLHTTIRQINTKSTDKIILETGCVEIFEYEDLQSLQ